MKIPLLVTNQQGVTNIAGKPVAIFINGVKATDIDYATFWPKQALRVEYMEYPSDPRFKGEECVVNFIMKRLDTGGVAKIEALQKIRNSGSYSVASKIEHGKMTYGVKADASYNRDHLSSAEGKETYSNLFYQNSFFNEIEKTFFERTYSRSDAVNAAFNARYLSGDTEITHYVALKWTHDPGSGTSGNADWNPDIFRQPSYFSSTKGHALSPQVSGSYSVPINSKCKFSGGWRYAFAHNDRAYSFRQEGEDAILNVTCEDVNTAYATASVIWTPTQRFSSFVQLYSSMNWYDTDYAGSASENSRQRRGETVAQISLWWRPTSYFAISVLPGITASYWRTDGFSSETEVTPRCTVNAGWFPSQRFYLSGNLFHHRSNPAASSTTGVLVRQTDLIWGAGNPYLKGNQFWSTDLYSMWLPKNWVRIMWSIGWNREQNETVSVYQAAPDYLGGLVRNIINGAPKDVLKGDLVITLPSLVNKIFSVTLQPTYRYYKTRGIAANSFGWFRMRGFIGADVGTFHISMNYGAGEKVLSASGTRTIKTSDMLSLSATYGTGDWFFRVSLNDVTHSRSRTHILTNAGDLRDQKVELTEGRNLKIDVSYTFGFGKKVKRNISISGPDEITSGAISM